MTKLIIVDNCTACPFYYRFQNPHLGEICFKVTDKDQHFRGIESRPKDEVPDWCPLPERITQKPKSGLDKETVKLIHGLGRLGPSAQYCDGEFSISLKDWDQILEKVKLERTVTGIREVE